MIVVFVVWCVEIVGFSFSEGLRILTQKPGVREETDSSKLQKFPGVMLFFFEGFARVSSLSMMSCAVFFGRNKTLYPPMRVGHLKGHNIEFISLVLRISRQFRHKYVQSKVVKSMFRFIRQISYVSTIHFLFNQSHFHYCLLLWLLLRSYRSYRI